MPQTTPAVTSPADKRRAWLYLLLASVFEITFALSTDASHGFTRFWPSLIVIIATVCGIFFLSRALRHLDVSIGYTVWTGIGAVGTVSLSAIIFGETITLAKAASFLLIITGIIGLKLADRLGTRTVEVPTEQVPGGHIG